MSYNNTEIRVNGGSGAGTDVTTLSPTRQGAQKNWFVVNSAWIAIAILGSILDSQLSWESGKFQLARWSHEVVLFSVRTYMWLQLQYMWLQLQHICGCSSNICGCSSNIYVAAARIYVAAAPTRPPDGLVWKALYLSCYCLLGVWSLRRVSLLCVCRYKEGV